MGNKYSGTSNIVRYNEFIGTDPSGDFLDSKFSEKYRPGLTVVVLNLEAYDLLNQIYQGVKQAGPEFEKHEMFLDLIIGDTGSKSLIVENLLNEIASKYQVHRNLDYNFSKNNNYLVNYADTTHLLFLNNDVLIGENPSAIWESFSTHLKHAGEVITSAKLMFPDLTVQHAGVEFFSEGDRLNIPYHPHSHKFLPPRRGEINYVSAVSGAFLITSRALFKKIEGFDEKYQKECQDIAYCLRARKIGVLSRVVDVGKLVHLENGTRPKNDYSDQDRSRFLRKYASFIEGVINA